MAIAVVSACETASLQTIQASSCSGSMQGNANAPSFVGDTVCEPMVDSVKNDVEPPAMPMSVANDDLATTCLVPKETLAERVQMILQEKKRVDDVFRKSAPEIGVAHFHSVESFPVDAAGNLFFPKSADRDFVLKAVTEFLLHDKKKNFGRAALRWPQIIATAYPWMQTWSLQDMLLALVARTLHHRAMGRSWLDVVEYFAGTANLSRAAIQKGHRVCALDKDISESHDVMGSVESIRLWLSVLAATKEHALVWHGTPCSSWTIMCRAVSERCESNNWLGNDRPFVTEGNTLADLSGLTIFLAYMMNCIPGLEQSGSSVMGKSPCLKGVLTFIMAIWVKTYHGCFGGNSEKPLQLWSSSSWIEDLARSKPDMGGSGVGLVSKSEDGSFTGIKDKLKASENYTPLFGASIIEAWMCRFRPPN